MRQARGYVASSCLPAPRHSARREILHLGGEVRRIALVNEVQDRHRCIAALGKAPANLDVTVRCRRQALAEQSNHAAEIMRAPHCSDVTCRAAEAAMTSGHRIIT